MSGALASLARRRAAWAALIGAALVLRLVIVLTAPRALLFPDGRYYESMGWELLTRHTYGDQTLYAPLYPTFVAAVYAVAGRDLLALRVAEGVLSAGTVALVGAIGGALFTPAAGLVAAALAAFHPVMALLPITQYPENLILLCSALALGAFAAAVRRATARWWLLAGGLLGLLTLIKPTALALVPGLALGAAWTLRRRPRALALGAVCLALAFAATLLPWMARNLRLHGRWYLVTTLGGWNLWLANNPATTGASDSIPAAPAWLVERVYAVENPVDREAVYRREAVRWIRENPLRALHLYLIKMGSLWALYPRTVTETPYRHRLSDWAQGLWSVALYTGAAVGTWRAASCGVLHFPLAVLSYTLLSSIYLMRMRYRMGIEVILLWLAGLGYVWMLGRARAAGGSQ